MRNERLLRDDLTDQPRRRRAIAICANGRPELTDFVEKLVVLAARFGVEHGRQKAQVSLFVSGGEDRRRMRNELRQFPEILGGGG